MDDMHETPSIVMNMMNERKKSRAAGTLPCPAFFYDAREEDYSQTPMPSLWSVM